ncbi:hypothetical protein K3495_g3886 [Podosphaera aphanis]|nr:hypothetical protein K3495_g3886 [Podosphaera aphanis]
MNEALQDEIAAINSIYGPGTLTPATDPDVYILELQRQDTSLRIAFPPTYPHVAPRILGNQRCGVHTRKGDAAHARDQFCATLTRLFRPGEVCLFDVMEEVNACARDDSEPPAPLLPNPLADPDPDPTPIQASSPQWHVSETVMEMKSVFVAHCARINCPVQAKRNVQHLVEHEKKLRGATHHITAWRIRGENGVSYQDCDDGGEQAAGSRLLHLMQLMDVWDAMVVVSRWYGGVHLGPRRFGIIKTVARDAFIRAAFAVAHHSNAESSKR